MVPNGWEITNFGQLAEFRNGLNFTKADRGEAIKIVGVADFKDHSSLSSFERLDTINVSNTVKENDLIKSGDVLFVRSNGNKDLIGRCLFFPEVTEKLSFSGFTIRGRVTSKDILPSYLALLSRSEIVKQQFSKNGGGTNISNLSQQILNDVVVPLPTIKEQRKIAQILSTWDRGIATTEKLINASKQQKKALMQQLLTGKKRLVNPDTGKVFEGEWELTHLKSLLIEEKSRNKDNKITRVLSVTNHSGFVLPEDQFSKRVASENISNYKIVKQGQFGYNPSRLNVGSFACLNQFSEGVLSPMYVVFSTNDSKLQRDYLSYWMDSHEAKQRIKNSTQGSVRESVGFDALCSFPFILPALNEQQKIASVLTAA
ncbi:restriction endonuclease subunit S, partial [Providencia sp. PROV120]|uniref:restriction endonuclease subunit S n=1 Tax=Providencia sp. PROV120 TaxID=2949831 RepID=UPI00234A04D6